MPFYWWLGDTLTREHLTAHLDELAGKHISSLQVNYAHSDKGGKSWGLTYKSQPEIFSDEWWNLFRWFAHEAKMRGMTVSLSDYTLGVGQEQYVDEIISARPEMMGYQLEYDPAAHEVRPRLIDPSLNPMHPDAGKEYIAHFFQRFEDKLGEDADNLNFFFSDELDFKLRGWLWDKNFEKEFIDRKGYDIRPHLQALFDDDYPEKAKYRIDYNDVMVSLSEENFFMPIYKWHQDRGLTYGCDHGGRGKDVTEFGDYFRTQRWNQGPGCDQPNLQHDVIKNKVASSISHLYQRPRVWLEGFYGSGWHTSSAMLVDAIFSNFAQGQNLLSLHGLYYSTPDSRWEWAPPCNHFRMPYWHHMPNLLECTERLSFLLSQGVHRSDIAIIYPVESVVAGDGNRAVDCAFRLADSLYYNGYDFDFIDYQSIDRATVTDGRLCVSGEEYSVLIVPDMPTILQSSLAKINEFQKNDGIVIFVGQSPRQTQYKAIDTSMSPVLKDTEIVAFLDTAIIPDFKAETKTPFVNHRKIGDKEIYAVYNVPKNSKCFFRAHGAVELWNPWNGTRNAICVNATDSAGTYVNMPLDATEMQILVFDKNREPQKAVTQYQEKLVLSLQDGWEMKPLPSQSNKFGDYHLPASDELITPEIRRVRYSYATAPEWKTADFADNEWGEASIGYDSYFKYSGPLSDSLDIRTLTPQAMANWHPYFFSWRYGVEEDCGHQGYHGLKAEISDEFIRLGDIQNTGTGMIRTEIPAKHHYLAKQVIAPADGLYQILQNDRPARELTVNGKLVPDGAKEVWLNKGPNSVVAHYYGATSSYLCFSTHPSDSITANGRIEMKWNDNDNILPMVAEITDGKCRYRIKTAPGTEQLRFVSTAGNAKAWVNGEKAKVKHYGSVYEIDLPKSTTVDCRVIAIELSGLDHKHQGAAAFSSPIKEICGYSPTSLQDWGMIPGMEYYSGGMQYRCSFKIDKIDPDMDYRISLGDVVSSAEVKINGKDAGIRLSAPWEFKLSPYIIPGTNHIDITVYNTAHNHYLSIPTQYNSKQKSGLLGPVKITASPSAMHMQQK